MLSTFVLAQTEQLSYGMHLSLNYPTVGNRIDNYSGEANPTLGLFLQYHPEDGLDISHPTKNKRYNIFPSEFTRRLTFLVQPSFSINTFRQIDVDRKYNSYYVELSGLVYIQPFAYVNEFKLFTGLRPSYLTAYNTEVFEGGFYTTKRYDPNLNRIGRYDLTMPIGISMDLSQAVTVEMAYYHSFSDNNTNTFIQGRPSSIEFTLKLNALGLVSQFAHKEDQLRAQITKYSKGSLIVMLPTVNQNEIQSLRKQHSEQEIEFITTELNERNKKIMHDFRTYFEYCPVYFFMDTSAYKVISKNFNNVFVNANFETDKFIHPDSSNFFMASICEDISAYTTKHVFGLFVYDEKLNQLPKPFNVPANLIGPNLEGDPLNFFKKRHYNYSQISFEKYITKLNNRMLRYKNLE